MLKIPQLANPISNRGYASNTPAGKSPHGGEQFDIIQLMNPVDSVTKDGRDGGRQSGNMLLGQKDFLPMSVKLAKDPTMALESLKQIINFELLASAKANGYTELHGELDELMKSLFLSPDGLLSEILSQEKSTTLFGDHKFYDILRQLIATNTQNAEELKACVGNMLKAVNYARNQQEILSALSANMKFLSHYFSPNKALSQDLADLAERWASADAPENFAELKGKTLALTKNVTESLLNNERIQVLVPLIIHNLSRYNTNKAVLHEYFAQLMTHVPGMRLRDELSEAFAKLAESLLGGRGAEEAANAHQAYKELAETAAGMYRDSEPFEVATGANADADLKDGITSFLKYLSRAENLVFDEDILSGNVWSFKLGGETGMETIKNMLLSLFNHSPDAFNPELSAALEAELAQADDISKLVNYLNDILKNLPDVPERQAFFEHLTDIINGMAEREEIPTGSASEASDKGDESTSTRADTAKEPARESTLKQLIEFVDKNIDHAAIKTINNYNASNLLQSLINAPGVFTPLAHYILPLEIDGIRSFGELWVDNDESNAAAYAKGGKPRHHLFLTFEVDAAGRFEIDLYADGNDVNLSFFYPESFKERAGELVGKVGKIIAQTGYRTREIRTGPLVKAHDLTQVFPQILESRTGFNVKA
ncbi:MAG: hypothetical protein FWH20_09470 [Oscillospiraceae bacterium]|nr:hypothetical protein [Oscillospiraceae bacterium]